MESRAASAPSRKVMVIADPTRESEAALQWALSHAVVDNDELVLLHVEHAFSWRHTLTTFLKSSNKPAGAHTRTPSSTSSSSSSSSSSFSEGGCEWDLDFLNEMKDASETAQPKAHVRVERVEIMGGKDKAATILCQSAALTIDLLVIGQRRSLTTAILGHRRNGGSARGSRGVDTAEYLIENSKCTCVGVQKKGQNAGYLLNTKTQKNFWLLA